jgi:hypothetical protein
MARSADCPALAACYRALARSGFIRHAPDALDWPLSPSFHVWLGLHARRVAATDPDLVEVEPWIGIHAVTVERLWTRLKVGPYRSTYRRHVATFAVPLLPLGSEAEPCLLSAAVADRAVLSRLVDLCRRVGLPFALSIASLDALAPLLEDRTEALGGNPERLASMLLLMGRDGEARRFIEAFRVRHPGYFGGFAGPALALLDKRARRAG